MRNLLAVLACFVLVVPVLAQQDKFPLTAKVISSGEETVQTPAVSLRWIPLSNYASSFLTRLRAARNALRQRRISPQKRKLATVSTCLVVERCSIPATIRPASTAAQCDY